MVGRQLVVIAAAVALAMTHVTDAKHHESKVVMHHREISVKVSIHKDHEANATTPAGDKEVIEFCLPGWTSVSVEGVDSIFCAKDQICVADIKDGKCPDAQTDLPYGSYCDKVKTGVYGCKPKTKDMVEQSGAPMQCKGEGESPMSVEGVEGVFCVKGQACVADIKDGACPGPQNGLENGAECGKVKTGVYGCKPKSNQPKPEEKPVGNPGVCTGKDESPMSVEGVEGIFCVTGQACVADIKDGACPGPQEGLQYGAECGKVKTGVYGCKPKSNQPTPEEKPVGNPGVCTGKDESPMSVEGVEGIFCVMGQACVADIRDGACPGKQEDLPNGAVCGKVKTGVYGCKPAEAGDDDDDDSDSDSDSDGGKCADGASPMSVEGVEGIFCVTGQACVADIKDGACPGPQEGLTYGAECGVVKSGVYGCKPKSAKKHRKSHSIKVVKSHAKKTSHKKH